MKMTETSLDCSALGSNCNNQALFLGIYYLTIPQPF